MNPCLSSPDLAARCSATERPLAISPRPPHKQSAAFRSSSAKLAGAILLLSGLASLAYADATWVGDTSQDWNTAANWSSDPANPSGNFTINTATAGVFPVVTAAPAFTPVDIFIGNGAGLSGRLDVTSGSVSTGTGNWLIMGRNGATGTLNVTGGTVNAQDIHLARTTNTGTATVNVGGTGIINTAGAIVLGDGDSFDDSAVATFNANAGAVVNCENDFLLAFAGSTSTVGTLNIAAGATVNVATTTKRWFVMSVWDSTGGMLNVNGGTLNLNANTDIQFSTGNWGPGASNGVSTITLNGGAINMGDASVINLNNNADRDVTHTLNLNGGTLTAGQIISSKATGARVINFNGATLKAAGSSATFIGATAASSANVKAGGAIIDSNGFDITIAKALTADTVSTGGGLTKLGSGTLTLSGVNTYTGNTTVSAGTLALADNASLTFAIGANGVNNKITGSGTVTIDGDFAFDLSGAGTTVGNSWQIVDIGTLAETFGGTFSVTGFSLESGKWIKPANGAYYQFDAATGVLSVINDPGVSFPPPTVNLGTYRSSYVLGSDFTINVTATGTGTLTYQWYYQANSGDTPVAISGATSASYSVTGATAGSGGIYSVRVTDSAAPSTPTTATFPVISVLPGTSFSVAYYRFEEGPDTAPITATNDSVGTNHLSVLGTPNYASDSLPYTKVPRTGATNTLGANFPASNNGLIAPTSGTLASAEFLDFTIEAFVRLDSLSGWQTIVGRDDDANPGQANGAAALFYLSKSGSNNGFRVELATRTGTNLQINSTYVPTVGTWYHVAAVGDAAKGTLTLYVNGASVGSTTGFTGLFVPTSGSDTPWTLGRGDYNAGDTDFLRGDVDEVRFSSAALPPAQFLASTDSGFVIPPVITQAPVSQTLRVGQSTTLSVTATGGTLSYEWYKNDVLISGQTGSTLALNSVTTGADGTYKVKVIDAAGASLGMDLSSTASAVVRVLDVNTSARVVGLNFVGTSTGGNFSTEFGPLASATSAGFIPAINWNNSGSNVATQTSPLTLLEKSGATPSYVTATWSSANTWSARSATGNPNAGEKTADATLLHGYIESRATTGASVTVSNIPYASYDVYVYVTGGGNGNVGSLSIDRSGSTTYYYKVLQHDSYVPSTTPTSASPYSLPFVIGEATSRETALTAPAATFVRFTGVTGADLTISAIDQTLNANAGGIAAVQIVDTTPAGTPYPPTTPTAPVSQLKAGGSSASFTVSAVSNNSGGVLSYQWQKDGVNIGGQTSATLSLSGLTGSSTGTYSVVITDNSSLGAASTTRNASLVVVDATRPLLINGDLKASGVATFVGNGILRTTGSSNTDLGVGTTVWNGVLGAAGSATRSLAKESTGLTLPGVSFTYAGAEGVEDNTAAGFINGTAMVTLSRDYLYTDNQTTPLTGSISGLDALVGQEVTLVVYAYGKLSMAFNEAATSDTATVTLATANNHLGSAPYATSTGSFEGRNIVDNNLISTSGATSAYATFTGVVAPGGTVNWSIGPDSDAGRIPLVGFQLLLTGNNLAPAVPTGLAAVGGNNQVSLTWNAVSGADTYTIGRSTTSGGPYTTISAGLVTGTSYTDNSAVNGTTYYYVVASAKTSPAVQSAYSAEASVTLGSGTTPLQSWRQTHFGTTANTGNAANTADPDGDGLVNLLEYALGTNPTVAAASPVTVGQSGGTLTLTFSPVVDTNLSYAIEASSDLAGAWSVVHTYGSFASTAPVTYTDSVVLSSVNSKRFLRLKVTSTE